MRKKRRPTLVIDSAIQFGRVTVPGTRITASVLAEFVMAGDTVDETADDYEVDRADVLVCCFWEVAEAVARPRTYRTAWERKVVETWGDWYEGLVWPYDFDAIEDPPAVDQ